MLFLRGWTRIYHPSRYLYTYTHARARAHTHTDEFICFIASEKERLAREKEAELEKLRITGCLDPLTKTLIAFDDTQDLHLKIDGMSVSTSPVAAASLSNMDREMADAQESPVT